MRLLVSNVGAQFQLLLTVFLVSLLVQVDVGLHVPDELMSQKLRLLSRPQDVLSNVAHLRTTQSQDQVMVQHPPPSTAYFFFI